MSSVDNLIDSVEEEVLDLVSKSQDAHDFVLDLRRAVTNRVERLEDALEWLMQQIDGFEGVEDDRYDRAGKLAGIGREPTPAQELEAFLQIIEEAQEHD